MILSSFCHLESGNIYNQLITAQGIIRQTIHRELCRSTKIDFGEEKEWKSISAYFLLFTLRMGVILKVTKPNWVLSKLSTEIWLDPLPLERRMKRRTWSSFLQYIFIVCVILNVNIPRNRVLPSCQLSKLPTGSTAGPLKSIPGRM